MTDEGNPSQQPRAQTARDETWKEQIRRAIEESQRNVCLYFTPALNFQMELIYNSF